MKQINYFLFVLIVSISFLSGCEEDYEIKDPVARFQIDNRSTFEVDIDEPYNATVGDQLVFLSVDYLNDADFYVIWTGDAGRNYDNYIDSISTTHPADTLFIEKDKGVSVPSSAGLQYAYNSIGTYTITWIATNQSGFGGNTKSEILQKEIVIVEGQE